MAKYKTQKFPDSRLATIDICEMGKRSHHVAGLIELDVSKSREKIREINKGKGSKISFTAWLISVIACTIKRHETASSYLSGKNKLMIFEDINVSILIEKDLNGQKVPIPLVIEKANEKSIESINIQIANAKHVKLSDRDIVLEKKTERLEKIYYLLPGFIRIYFWKYLLKHPKFAYKKMGNVAITAIGMMGKLNGWFIPTTIHPVCFGVGSIIKKPVVIDNSIEIREMLNMTVLLNHDVIDGAPMARFISDLSKNVEEGMNL